MRREQLLSAFLWPRRLPAFGGNGRAMNGRLPLILLALVSALGPGALHMVTPALPLLAHVFAKPAAEVQLVLTLYLAGIAIGQLVIGPVSDRFGRRPVMLWGLGLFLAGTLTSGFSGSLGVLIFGRVLQALGGCAGMVLGRAIIRDVCDRERAAGAIATVTMAMSLGTSISPAIGAYLAQWVGWRADFAFLAAYGAAVLWMSLAQLQETNQRPAALDILGTLVGSARLMRSPVFLLLALSTACTSASWFTFTAIAPYLLTEQLGEPPSTYGIMILLPMIGYILGAAGAARFSERFGSVPLFVCGLVLSLASGAMLAVWTLGFGLSGWSMMVPMALSSIGNGLSQPPGIAAGLSVYPRLAGAASGLIGFTQMTIAALGTWLIGRLPQRGGVWMVVVVVAFLVLSWLCGVLALRRPGAIAAPGAAADEAAVGS
jgi:DHA1 family bicyclomycin/chloramphenicol resistance-like MFS transporter